MWGVSGDVIYFKKLCATPLLDYLGNRLDEYKYMKLVIGHSNGQYWNTKHVNYQNYVYVWVNPKIYFI